MFYIDFDLNLPQVEHAVEAPVEGDNDNDVHVDDEPQDNHGGNASLSDQGPRYLQFFCSVLITYGRHRIIVFFTVDLNIPLDEFGAVDFSYIGNDAGKVFSDDVYL